MKQFMQKIVVLFAMVSLQSFADVQIRDGYVREMPPGQQNTAAFMHVLNSGDKPVVIVRAESSRAASVELHQHIHANGMMRMQAVPSITIPAKGEFVFKSGDYHVMLLGVTPAVKAGETVVLVFVMDDGARIAVDLPVKPITAAKPAAAADSAHSEHAGHHGHH
jgi:copper(I)-binding protein